MPGTYQTKLYVVTDKGCFSDTVMHSSVVNPLPVADLSCLTLFVKRRILPLLTNRSQMRVISTIGFGILGMEPMPLTTMEMRLLKSMIPQLLI